MKKTDKTTKHCCGNCAKYANKCRCRAYGRIAENYAKKMTMPVWALHQSRTSKL